MTRATRHSAPDFDTLRQDTPRSGLRAHGHGEIALIALCTDQKETTP